jgi:L-lactate utilization protein LutC
MDRLIRRVSAALEHASRRPHPGPAPVRGEGTEAELASRFEAALVRAAGRVLRCPDEAAARAALGREYAGRRIVYLEDGPSPEELRVAEVGVDRADVLLAETGTVLRSYRTREESRISLVPEVSVFFASTAALVPDLPAALRELAPAHREGRAYTVMVTGPSRTADIEKQLVIPAHGPREVLVLLVG